MLFSFDFLHFLACLNTSIFCTYFNVQGDLDNDLDTIDLWPWSDKFGHIFANNNWIVFKFGTHVQRHKWRWRIFFAGWIFVLAPAGASTPLVKIHTTSVNLIVIVQILLSILFLFFYFLDTFFVASDLEIYWTDFHDFLQRDLSQDNAVRKGLWLWPWQWPCP